MTKKKIVKKASKKKELPKPVRKKGEGPLEYYKRYQKWQKSRPPIPSKPVVKPKKGKLKPKKKLSERQKRIKARKEAEKKLGIKRGIKKKKKK